MFLFLKHTVHYTKNGVQIIKSGKTVVEPVTAVYADGCVRTKSGDVWHAKQLPNGNYESVSFFIS